MTKPKASLSTRIRRLHNIIRKVVCAVIELRDEAGYNPAVSPRVDTAAYQLEKARTWLLYSNNHLAEAFNLRAAAEKRSKRDGAGPAKKKQTKK